MTTFFYAIPAPNTSDVTLLVSGQNGPSDTVYLQLGSAATISNTVKKFQSADVLTLEDSAGNGIGHLNVNVDAQSYETSTEYPNGVAGTGGYAYVSTLIDPNLSSLTVTGPGDFQVNNTFVDTVKTLTLTDNSTSTYGLTFGAFVPGTGLVGGIYDSNLTTLNLAGSDIAASSTDGDNSAYGPDSGDLYLDSLFLGTQKYLTINDTFVGRVYIGCIVTGGDATNATGPDGAAGSTYLKSLTINNIGEGTMGFYCTAPDNGGNPLVSIQLPNLTTLNLNGDVGINVSGVLTTTGITVNAGTDNGDYKAGGDQVGVIFTTSTWGGAGYTATTGAAGGGAAQGYTDNITIGNGGNTVLDNGLGTVNIKLGTGSNVVIADKSAYITTTDLAGGPIAASNGVQSTGNYFTISAGSNAESGSDNITFAAHSQATENLVYVGYAQTTTPAGTQTASRPEGYAVIKGLNSDGADIIVFAADANATGAVNPLSLSGSFGNELATAVSDAAAHVHTVEAFTRGVNTWLVENNASDTTIVELVGTSVSGSSSVDAGLLTLHG